MPPTHKQPPLQLQLHMLSILEYLPCCSVTFRMKSGCQGRFHLHSAESIKVWKGTPSWVKYVEPLISRVCHLRCPVQIGGAAWL